jgi:hypothetical protein
MTSRFDWLIDRCLQYGRSGDVARSDGALLIGHNPIKGKFSYTHLLFQGLKESEIAVLEQRIQRPIPNELRDFYCVFNGIDLFAGRFSISGLRRISGRDGDAMWQPFDLRTPNISERPVDASADAVFFSFYSLDGSQAFICTGSSSIHLWNPQIGYAKNSWNSLNEMLQSEFERLADLYDAANS